MRSRLLRLVAQALVLSTSFAAGCSSGEETTPDPTPIERVRAKFEGQSVALLPFDATDPACEAAPETMERTTLASCAHLDPSRLPADLEITTSPMLFDAAPDRSLMLVVRAPGIDPQREVWIGIVGVGRRAAKEPVRLTTASAENAHPEFFPIVIGGVMLLSETAVANLLFGATAAVVAQQTLSQSQSGRIVGDSQRAIEQTVQLVTCPDDEERRLATAQKAVCRTLPNSCEKFLTKTLIGDVVCPDLSSRRDAYEACRKARQDVVDICYGGKPDETHAREINEKVRIIAECDGHISRLGC